MADSDNTTTLPFVIKRWRKRRGAVDAAQVSSCARCTTSPSIHVDPAFELWRRWHETHHAARVLCRLQQRQESRLLKLDARNRSGAEDLQTMNSQHEAARCAEIDAMDAEEQLLTACAATAATSLVGVLAKLEIIRSGGQGRAAPSEFPWPQIRSTVNDLRNPTASDLLRVSQISGKSAKPARAKRFLGGAAMFKIRVIRWSDRAENCDLLERYFRLRHAIYVETRKWSEIERPIPMEIDAFDDRNAIYLIGVDGRGSIMGGTRLVPTLGPHLLADVFPELACHEPPRGSSILEWTRFFVVVRNARAAGVPDDRMLQFPDIESNISALRARRIDVAVISSPTVIGLLSGNGAKGLERADPFVVSDEQSNYASVAFRKDDEDLRQLYDERLTALRGSGVIETIMAKYGFGAPEAVPDGMTAEKLCSTAGASR